MLKDEKLLLGERGLKIEEEEEEGEEEEGRGERHGFNPKSLITGFPKSLIPNFKTNFSTSLYT